MLKSYKYKIKPNEEQKVLLNKHFGSIRFAYNYFLNERKVEYETNKQTLNYNDNSAALTKLKKQEDFKWLREINSQSLQHLMMLIIHFSKRELVFQNLNLNILKTHLKFLNLLKLKMNV